MIRWFSVWLAKLPYFIELLCVHRVIENMKTRREEDKKMLYECAEKKPNKSNNTSMHGGELVLCGSVGTYVYESYVYIGAARPYDKKPGTHQIFIINNTSNAEISKSQ